MSSIRLLDRDFTPYISADTIRERNRQLGEAITEACRGRVSDENPLLVVSVLKGSFIFLADLVREIQVPNEIAFIRIGSYHGGMETSGRVQELQPLDVPTAGRHVLIVEDIVDSGYSLEYLRQALSKDGPSSLAAVALLHKAEASRVEIILEYTGFVIPNAFVVGYGLDYRELGRHLPDVCQVVE